jgi:hypothetical protein
VTLFQGRNPAHPSIDLAEPGGAKSLVSRFLKRSGRLRHLCHEVKVLESHLRFCWPAGAVIIRPPVPAVAFGGRQIAGV